MTICHSRSRANTRRGEHLIFEFGGRHGERPYNLPLSGSSEKKSIKQQQHDCADDRPDKTRWFSGPVPADGLAEITGNERAGDAEEHRHDAPAGIFAGHQQFRDRTDDKTDKQNPKNRVSAEVHMRTSSIELIV
jgi:hypothetical protein